VCQGDIALAFPGRFAFLASRRLSLIRTVLRSYPSASQRPFSRIRVIKLRFAFCLQKNRLPNMSGDGNGSVQKDEFDETVIDQGTIQSKTALVQYIDQRMDERFTKLEELISKQLSMLSKVAEAYQGQPDSKPDLKVQDRVVQHELPEPHARHVKDIYTIEGAAAFCRADHSGGRYSTGWS
jgi:hypothetical protein